VKTPDWYREAVAEHGAKVLDGTEDGHAAAEAVAAVLLAHPEHLAALAARDVAKWVKERESSGDLFQAALFPLLPASLYTAPKVSVRVSAMTAADLDKARNMLWNRTRHALEGAERQREIFSGFYDRVRPLLKGDKTVADALGEIAAKAA
jgi:hypothetical protein